jgi:hypothetical protein
MGAGGGASGALPCDVKDVLSANCGQCHSNPPVYGAPMPLLTHEDLIAPAVSDPKRKVYELVGERIHDAEKPMPQPPNMKLGAADLKVLDDWIGAGAPASQEECGGGAGGAGGGGTGVSCTPDLEIAAAAPWSMPQNVPDIYVCYGFDVSFAEERQITAFAPRVDNATIVHHMLLYKTDSTYSATPQACAVGGGQGWRLMSVWAPGGEAFELPPEAGLPLDGTSHFVVQVHYSNLTKLSGEKDGSGFSLCTTKDLRPNEADILAFGTTNFSIPAAGSLDITCDFNVPAQLPPTRVIGGMPHMHLLGKQISTVVHPGGTGAPQDIGSRDPWDFNNQFWTKLDVTVKGGDKISTRCAWENPGAMNVGFGEDTSDEMCYGFVLYYPRIEAPGWNWGLPAIGSQCAKTP